MVDSVVAADWLAVAGSSVVADYFAASYIGEEAPVIVPDCFDDSPDE